MLRIDPTSSTPPYEQLRHQLIDQISTGELSPGVKLPAVRRLAMDLGLAPNTVARTYRELEAGGYVHTRGRNGTIVATPDLGGGADITERATTLTAEYVSAMTALGLSRDTIVRYVQRGIAA